MGGQVELQSGFSESVYIYRPAQVYAFVVFERDEARIAVFRVSALLAPVPQTRTCAAIYAVTVRR